MCVNYTSIYQCLSLEDVLQNIIIIMSQLLSTRQNNEWYTPTE